VFFVGGGGGFLRDYIMRGQGYEEFVSMTGRVGIWDAAWNFLKGSPLIGYGYQTAHRFDLSAHLGPGFSPIGTVENTFLEVMLDVGIVGLLPILAATYQLAVWLSKSFRVSSLRWRFRKTRCEVVAALVIVFIKTVNGPTFQAHSIYLLTLLISMAFIQVLLKQPGASTRSKVRVIQSFGLLVASDRTA
jgi:O-antigen ligase